MATQIKPEPNWNYFYFIFNKFYRTRLDAVLFENASPVKHSKRLDAFLFQNVFDRDFVNNRVCMRFYLQPRLNASFVSLGTRSDAFDSVRFARKWNAFQTRFEAKNIYMGPHRSFEQSEKINLSEKYCRLLEHISATRNLSKFRPLQKQKHIGMIFSSTPMETNLSKW